MRFLIYEIPVSLQLEMSVFVASLNSGSNGNCYYVGSAEDAVLVDAGISCRETEKRMKRIGLSFEKVRAIFISHEHSDHIRGLEGIAKKYRLPVYITAETHRSGGLRIDPALTCEFKAHEPVSIASLHVTAFGKLHDAADPHSFIVEHNAVKVGVMTDIGSCCTDVNSYFSQCHAAILEANYDHEMLMNGRYPYYLKKRISGGKGHLSNTQALELFTKHKAPHLSHLILGHLSRDNNSPELVQDLFSRSAGKVRITVASRYQESPVFRITNTGVADNDSAVSVSGTQLDLFAERN